MTKATVRDKEMLALYVGLEERLVALGLVVPLFVHEQIKYYEQRIATAEATRA